MPVLTSALGRVMNSRLQLLLFLFGTVAVASTGGAGDLQVQVFDRQGQPLGDAVVAVRRQSNTPGAGGSPAGRVLMDQEGRQFRPWVAAIRVGGEVVFANHDDITHHVYSFSEPRQFSFRLQSNRTREPMRFDKPGVVVIGCNIHDWMVGYILVSDAHAVSVTGDDGLVNFPDLAGGRWRVSAWHPGVESGSSGLARDVELGPDTRRVTLTIEETLAIRAPPEPLDDAGY